MVQASWNGKQFGITPTRLYSLDDLKSTFKANTQTNQDDSGSPPTTTKGYDLQQVDLAVLCVSSSGVDPRKEFDDWLRLTGQSAPLYLGGQIFGPDMLELVSVKLGSVELDPLGRIHSAKISLSFKEDAEEAAGQKGRVGSYLNIQSGSAASVGASAADKDKRAYTLG